MKKIINLFYVCLIAVISSCGSDDDAIGNLPPMEVSNIEAEVIEGTLVRISWTEAEDVNNDELSYDVVINDRVVADKTSELSTEFNVASLLANRSSNLQKGLSLELTISIKAYDTNGGVSEESVVKRNVFVNRDPNVFEFANINFDFSYYNWLEVSWYPAIDEDDDILSYDVYLNDIVLRENYIIGSDDYDGLGNIYYNSNYSQYADDEIIIKIVANDRDGGITEISKSFDFRATDVDLGMLSLPHDSSVEYVISQEEVDRRVGYTFQVEENTGYVIQSSEYLQLRLSDNQGNYITGNTQRLFGESLSPGTYYLEIEEYYNNSNSSGTLSFVLKDPKESDVDLGALGIPYEEALNFSLPNNEPDNKIGYTFQVSEETGFSVFSQNNINFELREVNGNFITSGYRRAFAETIQPGTYYLEVYQYYNDINSGSFTMVLKDPTTTDVDLGALSIPYTDSVEFNVSTTEPDGKIRYLFEINSATGYSFTTQTGIYLNLYDGNGNYINSGYRDIYGENLNTGSYYLEIVNQDYNDVSGTLNIALSNPNESDIDLGALTAPYNQSFDFNTTGEIDRKIRYEFSVDSEVSYAFEIINENYDDYIYLYDASGNYISGSDYYQINGTLSPGNYYVEVAGYSNNVGFGTLVFNLQ
ncbi:hypothetical protein SAMN04487910_1047 [Aquimarina amphilecti]|uniref:Uncharacterized protein n=1 Tax=Aquimarina amphilecti TaxID=1038014 RepID=A0A1H7JMZ0_AQUAM|nr:hypothetical protein [Aquimarina amphilecti]SEK76009.1 hypothetical protein SAMN04487910_1047 [Aquimarina amphilecti]